jgi:ubiquinone/menaquinone biosynthesis C-methylase UbiE
MMSLSALEWHNRFTQQAIWTREVRKYLFNRAGLDKSIRVLDVGCGTGAIRVETKPEINQTIHGLDINFDYLRMTRVNLPFVYLTQGDGHALPYASRHFDIVFCHYLLLWVTDPLKVLSEMVRLARNGGSVLALAEPDYGGRIDYPPQLDHLGYIQTQALEFQGADVTMGRKLGQLFSKAGLEEIEIGIVGAQWQKPLTENEIKSEWTILRSDLDEFKGHTLSKEDLMVMHQIDLNAWKNRERILFVPTFYACGSVPEKIE